MESVASVAEVGLLLQQHVHGSAESVGLMSAVHADAKLVELFSNVARFPPGSCRRRRKEHVRRAAAVGCALLCLALFRGSGLVSRSPRAEGLVGRVSRSVTDRRPKPGRRRQLVWIAWPKKISRLMKVIITEIQSLMISPIRHSRNSQLRDCTPL